MRRRVRATVAALGISLLSMLLPAATSAETGIVSFLTAGKIKVGKRVQYEIACSVECQVIIRQTLKLRGRDLAPIVVPGTLAANIPATPYIILNKPGVRALKGDVASARLVSSVTATDVATGSQQRIRTVFAFKRARHRHS